MLRSLVSMSLYFSVAMYYASSYRLIVSAAHREMLSSLRLLAPVRFGHHPRHGRTRVTYPVEAENSPLLTTGYTGSLYGYMNPSCISCCGYRVYLTLSRRLNSEYVNQCPIPAAFLKLEWGERTTVWHSTLGQYVLHYKTLWSG